MVGGVMMRVLCNDLKFVLGVMVVMFGSSMLVF